MLEAAIPRSRDHRRARVFAAAAFGAAVALLGPVTARGDDGTTADSLAHEAAAQGARGHHREAATLYEQALVAEARPAFLRALAAEHEALAAAGDVRDVRLAIFYYEDYLRLGPPGERGEISARIARLRNSAAKMAAPPSSPAPDVTMERRTHSPALAAGGWIMAGLGVAQIIVGAVLWPMGTDDEWGYQLVAIPLWVHGAACTAGGIPMIVVGQRTILVPVVTPVAGIRPGTHATMLGLGGTF